jgi:ABC-type bacteriocin/lantibiotic exporter with double-glycine peptidase domain
MPCWRETHGLRPCSEDCHVTLLKIPDVRQDKAHNCAHACIAAVCDYWNKARPRRDLSNAVQGMAPETVESVLRSLGFLVARGDMFIPLLQGFVRSGVPVLCPITREAEGHWVVVNGVARNRVYYHDPIDGQRSVSFVTWNDVWRDSSDAGRPYQAWGVAPHLT